MTSVILGAIRPLRMAIWRSDSTVSHVPMEWARIVTSRTDFSSAAAVRIASSAVRE